MIRGVPSRGGVAIGDLSWYIYDKCCFFALFRMHDKGHGDIGRYDNFVKRASVSYLTVSKKRSFV